MERKIAFYTIADNNNLKYYEMLKNSFKHFHPDVELILFGEEEIKKTGDQHIFYRAAPHFGNMLFDRGYDWVCKLDCDQIILGDLSYLWTTRDYDVATVLNINRVDPQKYGYVTVANLPPQKYYNAGLVACSSPEFMEHWGDVCNGQYFLNMQFREQDILNILCHFGKYKVRCLDYYDMPRSSYCWWGAVFKGEEAKAILRDGRIFLPRGVDGYPDREIEVKIWHTPGPEAKLNYHTKFSPEVSDYIDTLVK